MTKNTRRANSIILSSETKIGHIDAENDDQFLFDCFVHHPAVAACLNPDSPAIVLEGRTGAGKTAILRHIKQKEKNVAIVDPTEMALSYVANSTIIRFLDAIGADLGLMFQSLWKHVLCVEFIRVYFAIESESRSIKIFDWLNEKFNTDPNKKRALKYLKEWEGKFWITIDENVREITEMYEKKLSAEFGAEINKFRTKGQYAKQLSVEKKSELAARAQQITNAGQLIELNSVIKMLHEIADNDPQKKHFILIDRLDEHWVETEIRFRLIRSLIDSLKTFQKIRNLKLFIALRSDVLERVIQETGDLSFQREKYDEYFVPIKWKENELKELVQKRIRSLFKRQYTGDDVQFSHIFPYNVGNSDPFQYMIKRTQLRPRDIITFINECFKEADGQHEVSAKTIRKAEREFSRIRRQALENEWASAFPTLPKYLDFLANFGKTNFKFSEIYSFSIGKSVV